jgi:putative transcriptional regulator
MENSKILKNELIFQYASGTANLTKSLLASTYLFLNSRESNLFSKFERYCGEQLKNTSQIQPKNLKAEDCINFKSKNIKKKTGNKNPIYNFVGDLKDLNWKKIYNGFYEYSFKVTSNEKAKIIKMNPGTKVPLHSHNGREYILVLEGSFCDEYGKYSKGDLQINDSKIKHTPVASDSEGCICLSITEKELVFYGPFASILNLVTFIKSLFVISK